MFGASKYRNWLPHPGYWKKDSDPPDYGPIAQASEESARIMGELGEKQLAFAERQYNEAAPVIRELAQQQIDIGKQTAEQGQDYYDYMVTKQRPVEDALNAEAMRAGSEEEQQAAAGRAMADVRQGTTRQQNQLIRQGLRYGWTPDRMGKTLGDMATQTGLAEASAGNQAREKEKAMGYAKKLDVAGLYRGMPGASQGAYSTALQAGNSASSNTMAPGGQYMQGMAQGASTIGSGQQMKIQGLGSILNSQTQIAANQDSGWGGLGSVLGGAAQLYTAFSDRRLKENIVQVGVDAATGLNLYEFNYIGMDQRFRGVMADEVERVMPKAVGVDYRGYAYVDYGMLGIEMKEVGDGTTRTRG